MMLDSGQSARRVSNKSACRFHRFPGGSLDRNPPRLLIFFAEGNSTMRPTGAEHRRHAKADG